MASADADSGDHEMDSRTSSMRFGQRSAIGLAGIVAGVFGLYALIFPAFAVLYLTDGFHFGDVVSKTIGIAATVVLTSVIAAELVLAGALVRTAFLGAWPGRAFVVGRPAAAIYAGAFAVVAVFALAL